MRQLTDLRQILRYVPRFRDKIFVIALDGAIVDDDNFSNLLLDIALLRSLRIDVILVHGAGWQIRRLAEENNITPSNIDGTGITNEETFQLALTAANGVTFRILEGLSAHDLRGALSNALVAHPAGILQGTDYLRTGRVERIDVAFLRSLLERDIIPVIQPLANDGEGTSYRLNSDAVAVEVAKTLEAVKLIYLTTVDGVKLTADSKFRQQLGVPSSSGKMRTDQLVRQMSIDEADLLAKKFRIEVDPAVLSKLDNAIRASRGGVPRVHIIDGRIEEGLLGEVFSNEGTGTLIYANEYQSIRPAQKKDIAAIHKLIQAGVENDELLKRTRTEIERQLSDFFVFDVDRNPIACVAVHLYPELGKAELACLCVNGKFENQGIGVKMMRYGETQARSLGVKQLLSLSTQAFNYFVQKGGFARGTPDDLPPDRRERYDQSGRRSQILVKNLT